jgi:hypothetical protein
VTGLDGYNVGPIGLTATGRGITAFEPGVPVLATQPHIVLVAGLDGSGDGARVVLDLLAWRLSDGSLVRNRRRWQVAAVPCVLTERCDPAPSATLGRRRSRAFVRAAAAGAGTASDHPPQRCPAAVARVGTPAH